MTRQRRNAFLRQPQHRTIGLHLPVKAGDEQHTPLLQPQRAMYSQAQPLCQLHIDRLVSQNLRQCCIAAAAELDDEMGTCIAISQCVIEMQQALPVLRQQQLGPLALHAG